jgi:hypothetical protein
MGFIFKGYHVGQNLRWILYPGRQAGKGERNGDGNKTLMEMHLASMPWQPIINVREMIRRCSLPKAFEWMEHHSHDPVNYGYFQHMQRNGTLLQERRSSSTAETGYKDQNSSIHLLEALRNYIRYGPMNYCANACRKCYSLSAIPSRHNKDGSGFFKANWTPVSPGILPWIIF